jgi:3-phenylpropionate/cinnamic acid dioxygenase small subunit
MEIIKTGRRVTQETHYAITQHYFAEASLLQERCYREWLETMVAPDIHFWMPIIELRYARDRRPEPTPDDAAFLNEGYQELAARVEQLYTGLVWMEDPPTRTRYFITNVEAFDAGNGEYDVRCNILVTRHRRQDEVAQHSIGREDRLRRDGEGFKVAKRKLLLDARVVQDKNLYFFV